MKKNIKGEITTQQIVMLIILLVSFTIILFLLFRLNIGEETEKELCHNSVVTRGSSVVPTESMPLKCSRTYLCITEDGSCEGLTNPEVKKVKSKEEFFQVLADEMVDCWWMFGEGKVNYVGSDFKSNLYCSICSQVLFDDSLIEIEERFSEKEFYEFLEEKQYSEDETYLEYLTGLTSAQSIEDSISQEGGSFGYFDLGKQYFIMMGIYSEVGVWKWVVGAGIVGGVIAAPFTGGVSSIAVSALIVGGASVGSGFGGYYIGTTVKGDSGYDFLSPVIIEANSEEFNVLKCKDITTVA